MNLTCLVKEKNMLEVKGEPEDESVLRLVAGRLLNVEGVGTAMVRRAHPSLSPPILHLTTTGKKSAEDVLKAQLKDLVADVDGLLQSAIKARS